MTPQGLVLVPNFITTEFEDEVNQWFGPPPTTLDAAADRNRVVRYGPAVDATGYSSGIVVSEIPSVLVKLSALVVARGLQPEASNAITVNEYLPGQGIHWHTDKPIAGATIVVVGLLADATFALRKTQGRDGVDYQFPRRALLKLTGESRYDWQHSILPVDSRRLSVVLRHA